jgi:hypothetical protein
MLSSAGSRSEQQAVQHKQGRDADLLLNEHRPVPSGHDGACHAARPVMPSGVPDDAGRSAHCRALRRERRRSRAAARASASASRRINDGRR